MVLCIVKFPAVVSVVWRIFARFRGTVSIDSADCKNAFSVLFGSVLEHLAVNRSVVGSSPTGGAHKARKFNVYGFYLFPRATSQADMLACPFCGCRESQRPSGALTLQHAPRGQISCCGQFSILTIK